MLRLTRARDFVRAQFNRALAPLVESSEKNLILQGQNYASVTRKLTNVAKLSDVEFKVFSQWGEDGIIDWLIERLDSVPRTFVEFGVGNYSESNTRFLLQLRNWRGFVIDGSQDNVRQITRSDFFWRHDLSAAKAFVDCDNIDSILSAEGMSGEIGLLSVDVDGNDYWILRAINSVRPAIVVCEYNAVFGDKYQITIPYQSNFVRGAAHFSNLYFGASLPAIVGLARAKGYFFAGTSSAGCNAFFVREDLAGPVRKSLAGSWGYPSALRESRNAEGELSFMRGSGREAAIGDMFVLDLLAAEVRKVSELGPLCSPEWQSGLPCVL